MEGSLDHGRSPDQSKGRLLLPAKSTDGKREAGLQDARHGPLPHHTARTRVSLDSKFTAKPLQTHFVL